MEIPPRSRVDRHELLFWLIVLVASAVIFTLRTAYLTLGDAAAGRADTLGVRMLEEGTGTVSGLMVLPWLVWITRRVPPQETPLWQFVLTHAGAFVVYTVAHTLLMIGLRIAAFPALDVGSYDPSPIGLRMLSEAPNDAFFYLILVAAVVAFDGWRARRERERQYLRLQVELARAQLSNLQLQLQPHFLFNALNTISSVMYEDVRSADEMIGHLGELLRRSLAMGVDAEVPLREELKLLRSYLLLALARFGQGVEVRVDVQPDAETGVVPPLLLQPLVENAFKHGVSPAGEGVVQVAVRRDGGSLELVVENEVRDSARRRLHEGSGTGLGVTRRRLELLYGDASSMSAGALEGGGRFRVVIRLPWRAVAGEARLEEREHARAHS